MTLATMITHQQQRGSIMIKTTDENTTTSDYLGITDSPIDRFSWSHKDITKMASKISHQHREAARLLKRAVRGGKVDNCGLILTPEWIVGLSLVEYCNLIDSIVGWNRNAEEVASVRNEQVLISRTQSEFEKIDSIGVPKTMGLDNWLRCISEIDSSVFLSQPEHIAKILYAESRLLSNKTLECLCKMSYKGLLSLLCTASSSLNENPTLHNVITCFDTWADSNPTIK